MTLNKGISIDPEMEVVDLSIEEESETHTCVGGAASPTTEGKRRSIPPVNYLRVSKRGLPVEGQYVLNLSLPPPPQSAPGIVSDQDRKNLYLFTTSGSINADVSIIHDGSGKSKRASIELCTNNGFVRAKVHDPTSPDGNSRARPSLDLDLRAYYGGVSVSLPRCFRGPITISTGDERTAFSPELEEYLALVSDVPGIRVYFVGERPLSGKWGLNGDVEDVEGETLDEEPLDELFVGGKFSSVRINWDGEDEPDEMRPSGWQTFCGGAERFFTSGRLC